MDQKPTIGRIVHFHPGTGDKVYPAMVTHVWGDNGCVNLNVFDDGSYPLAHGQTKFTSVMPRPEAGWTWPPRN